MIRSVVVVAAYLVGLAASVAAEPLSTRDILHLNQFAPRISSISWCTDNTLTFVSAPPEAIPQPPWPSRNSILNILWLMEGMSRPFLAYPNSAINAQCARGGEFVSVTGSGGLAYRPGHSTTTEPNVSHRFTHLVTVADEQRGERRQIAVRNGVMLHGPWLTDVNGNVFARVGGNLIERKHINIAGLTEREQKEVSFKVQKDSIEFAVLGVNDNRIGPHFRRHDEFVSAYDTNIKFPPNFRVYGLHTSTQNNVGLFQCPAPWPGCVADSPAKSVVLYTSSYYATSKVTGPDDRYPVQPALYTVVPGLNPQIRRWPIIKAYASKHPYELFFVDVAIDAQRCIVMLEQNREHPSSRIEGRLNLDLFVADCQAKDGKLAYGEPRKIAHQQGSFMRATLGIYGESIVIADVYANGSQEEDQIKLEEADNAKARVCARFFTGNSAATLRRTNSLCGLASHTSLQPDSHTYAPAVSPGGKFVVFRGYKDQTPLIVGRDFRQDGRGPEWLTNEE